MAKKIYQEMNRPTFSIIVPVYNASRFLKRCTDSIAAQTYTDFEVLLIDDGSTDGSGEICETVCMKDGRFKCLHLENGGVSSARNSGLELSVGRYVTFVDSDDTLEPGALETYYRGFESDSEIDAVKAGYLMVYAGKKSERISIDKSYVLDCKPEIFKLLEESRYYSFVWNLCIKRECVDGVRFKSEINWLEDHIFSYESYFNCRKIAILPDIIYNYFNNQSNEPTLSDVANPWVIWTASTLEYRLKKKLNASTYPEVDHAIDDCYRYNICRLVNVLYNGRHDSNVRKQFATQLLLVEDLIYRNEKIFFNKRIPFRLRDWLLRLLTTLRK